MNDIFYELLIKINLILITIIGIDNRYFVLLYCNKLYLFFQSYQQYNKYNIFQFFFTNGVLKNVVI